MVDVGRSMSWSSDDEYDDDVRAIPDKPAATAGGATAVPAAAGGLQEPLLDPEIAGRRARSYSAARRPKPQHRDQRRAGSLLATARSKGDGMLQLDDDLWGDALPAKRRASTLQGKRMHVTKDTQDRADAGVNIVDPDLKQRGDQRQRTKHDCRGWRVVVCGHSLGAAAAALVAMQLRAEFQDVVCWSFSPPGGLTSIDLSRAMQDFCCSVVMGKDLISRLSLATLERLRDEMITSLARCKMTKARLLLGSLNKDNRRRRAEHVLLPYDRMPREAQRHLNAYHDAVRPDGAQGPVELYPPGRVMFLQPLKRAVKSRAGSRCCRAGVPKAQERYFVPVWVEPEELMSEGILVSSYMLEDHTPGVMLQQLQLLIDAQEQSGGAPAAGAGGAAAVAAAEAAV